MRRDECRRHPRMCRLTTSKGATSQRAPRSLRARVRRRHPDRAGPEPTPRVERSLRVRSVGYARLPLAPTTPSLACVHGHRCRLYRRRVLPRMQDPASPCETSDAPDASPSWSDGEEHEWRLETTLRHLQCRERDAVSEEWIPAVPRNRRQR